MSCWTPEKSLNMQYHLFGKSSNFSLQHLFKIHLSFYEKFILDENTFKYFSSLEFNGERCWLMKTWTLDFITLHLKNRWNFIKFLFSSLMYIAWRHFNFFTLRWLDFSFDLFFLFDWSITLSALHTLFWSWKKKDGI